MCKVNSIISGDYKKRGSEPIQHMARYIASTVTAAISTPTNRRFESTNLQIGNAIGEKAGRENN